MESANINIIFYIKAAEVLMTKIFAFGFFYVKLYSYICEICLWRRNGY